MTPSRGRAPPEATFRLPIGPSERAITETLVLVSNRGPVTFERSRAGARRTISGGGGLVTALTGLIEEHEAVWVSAAISKEDRAVAAESGTTDFAIEATKARGRFVVIDPTTYHMYYNVIANPMLWFIQHYLWDLSNAPEIRKEELTAWTSGYLAANVAFAEEVSVVLDRTPRATVMLHDYHLYTAPLAIRETHPQAFLHHFVHIPWPQPDYWRILPPVIREAILGGLLANDIVAFHTQSYARNFMLCCEDLLGAPVDYARRVIHWRGREVWVRGYPISINAPAFEALAQTRAVANEEAAIVRRRRRQLIVRIDRADLSKNVLRGFRAFDRFLERYPEYLEEVTFLAQLQPTRQDVEQYVEYRQKIEDLVSHINTKYGNTDWMPIDLRIEQNMDRTLALYKHYDVLLVNSIFDGMNLVAKEAALVNERDGVLILSENTGAHEELGAFALTVNPFDIEAQAEALHTALSMPTEARAMRGQAIKDIVRNNNIGKWLDAQQADIRAKRDADELRGDRPPVPQ